MDRNEKIVLTYKLMYFGIGCICSAVIFKTGEWYHDAKEYTELCGHSVWDETKYLNLFPWLKN